MGQGVPIKVSDLGMIAMFVSPTSNKAGEATAIRYPSNLSSNVPLFSALT